MDTYSTSNRINFGKRIIPIKMIELFSPLEWEDFVEEWLDLKKKEYHSVEKFGGAGDIGRDVVAYIDNPSGNVNYKWDCYQCKHYNSPIMPSKVYVEFGKIIYYSFIKEFPVPNKYYFIAPKDCGTSLSKLLLDPSKLKEKLIEVWEDNCRHSIAEGVDITLTGDFLNYVNSFNFSIFDKIPRKKIVEEHVFHPNHLTRFGGGLDDRPRISAEDVPKSIQAHEEKYVSNLLEAYNSATTVSSVDDLTGKYSRHFKKAREGFHFAEQLRVLYRDSLPINTFEDFQNEIYNGIINTVDSTHSNSFEKVKAVEDKSQKIQITSNPLKDVSRTEDRTGICHQLSNDRKIDWKNEK